jgi:hypothetical protein
MAATGNSCFWLAYFFKSSPLKPLSQMNRHLVGIIYGRSSIKIASPVAAMFVNGSGRNEQSLWRTFHRWFLPSFSSFGWGVLKAYLSVIQFIVSIFKLEFFPFPHKNRFFINKHGHHRQFLFLIGLFLNIFSSEIA